MATYREAAVNLMLQLARSGRGYDYDGHEWTNLETMYVYGIAVEIPAGNTDCSASVGNVYKALNLIDKSASISTRNIDSVFVNSGYFRYHSWTDDYVMRPGDLALCQIPGGIGHVAMCVSPDFTLADFWPGVGGRVVPFYETPMSDGTGWNICLELLDSIGNRTWSGSGGDTGGGATNGSISVDGYWGSATTSALQRHYGTVVDGIVSHQWEPNITANPALTSGWQCDETAQGSPMIRKLQEDLGTEVDGIFGGPDIYALQSKCGTVADGVLWGPSPCVMEMQRRLNAGTW